VLLGNGGILGVQFFVYYLGRDEMDGPVDCGYEEVTARQGKRRDAGDIGREWLNKKRDPCLLLASA
jgi:hypothetical protein